MHFVNPLFLLGLTAIAIPIVIHLFNFRRFKKIYFTNVKFIDDLKKQTQKQSKLKHLIILSLRILAITSLVLAFAQPYVPLNKQPIHPNSKNAVSVYIDNSFSMEARGSRGTLLDEAKIKALEVAAAYKSSDVFQLLTNDFEGRHQRLVTKEEFTDLVNEIKPSPSVKTFSEVTSRQDDILNSAPQANKSSYLISDFQKSTSDIRKIKSDTAISRFMVPVTASQVSNLYIDSCWFDSPVRQVNQQCRLVARIKNSSLSDYEKIPVKLIINGTQRAVASFDCKAGAETEVPLSFTNNSEGLQMGLLEIVDYPITYDDKLFFSFRVLKSISVLSVFENQENKYLNTLFARDSAFNYSKTSIKNLEFGSLASYSMIILDQCVSLSTGFGQEIKNFVQKGGSLVIIPPVKPDLNSYQVFLNTLDAGSIKPADTVNTKISRINTDQEIYRDVFDKMPENLDMPKVFTHFPVVSATRSGTETILNLENGDPFLVMQRAGKGRIYVFACPFESEFTNFPKHSIFVPTLYNMALISQFQEKLFYTMGSGTSIEYRGAELKGENVYKISKMGGGVEFIPETRLVAGQVMIFPHDQLKDAGNYFLMDGKDQVMGISFNYDRKESEMRYLDAENINSESKKAGIQNLYVINTKEKPVSDAILELNKGVHYWKLFIIMALLFLAGEVALLRLWR